MDLSPAETANRIKAGRLLRGLSQRELAERLREEGLPWRLAGQLEREEVVMRPAYCRALADILRLPTRWFTDPVDELVHEVPPPGVEERYDTLESKINELLDRCDGQR